MEDGVHYEYICLSLLLTSLIKETVLIIVSVVSARVYDRRTKTGFSVAKTGFPINASVIQDLGGREGGRVDEICGERG